MKEENWYGVQKHGQWIDLIGAGKGIHLFVQNARRIHLYLSRPEKMELGYAEMVFVYILKEE